MMTTAQPLPPAVDLRSNIDTVYGQASTNACTAHALTNALDILHERAGQPKRFSRAWVYWWSRVHNGRPGENIGANYDDFKWSLEKKGAVLEADHPWEKYNTPPAEMPSRTGAMTVVPMTASIDAIKRKLCLGVPVVVAIAVNEQLYSLAGQKDWRLHQWSPSGLTLYGHAVCVVGYDDAASRLLVENSWGPGWADGGFFGIPYVTFPRIQLGAWVIDRIAGIPVNPVEGYVSIPYLLDPLDNATFTTKNRDWLIQSFTEALQTEGIPGVLDLCRRRHVTDKHLENLFRWERGAVRAFQDANPAFDWADFPWAPL